MTRYISKKKEEYTLQKGWDKGDIVMMSEFKAAWRVNKWTLISRSPVFRDMFQDSDSPINEVKLSKNTNAELTAFLDAIHHKVKTTPVSFSDSVRVIDLLPFYKCFEEAKTLLYDSSAKLGSSGHFEAFALASRLNDVASGGRILSQGHQYWRGKKVDGMREAFSYPKPSLYFNMSQHPWTKLEVKELDEGWNMALTRAFITINYPSAAHSGKRKWGSEALMDMEMAEYWEALMGEFMIELFKD